MSFTKDPVFAHVRALVYHRYHRANHLANTVSNSGPLVDINTYITECTADGILEGILYFVMAIDTGIETMIKSMQKSWRVDWTHSGQDG